MISGRALGVIAVVVCGQVLIGLLAAAALWSARRRASRRTVAQIAIIIGFVESFALAQGLAALVQWRGGSQTLSIALLWYAGAGWLIVQVVIAVWVVLVWARGRRR